MAITAVDMDTTLLDPAGELTDRTAAAVRVAAETGRRMVLATGRRANADDGVAEYLEELLKSASRHP